ncbi:MAG TPA: transglycosylase SLT domain-containing protein [Longimicrobiales bacterium]|nr:transglycosylase SLT domain-containing protein [Longimicrobiales bacterium]
MTEHPEVEVFIDEILASPVLRDPDFARALDAWVRYWRGPAAPALPGFLGRMASFEALVDSALAANRLPPSLRYLPFIESGYNPGASSRAAAVGMWQFMEGTARERGMEVSPLLDQRRDPVRSTDAAVGFLSELHAELGSWFWVLAAYNGGPNRARRILRTYADGETPTDSLFWTLRTRFPLETRDFVPKLIGAVMVAGDPEGHGVEPTFVRAFRFDEVSVPDATTLDVVARVAGVSQAEIERLNPEYVRRMTPPGRRSTLRVPEGHGAAFEVAYALIPANERISFVMHRVAQGETLSHIAVRYGVRVADIEAANPGIRPRYLRVGRTLTVPVAPSARRAVETRS